MPFGRVYLDSNIIISLVAGDSGIEVSRMLVDMVGAVDPSQRQPFATSELTLSESMVRAIRTGTAHDAQTFDNMVNTSGWLEVGAIDRTVLLWAAVARAKYVNLKLPDAIHVASAIRLGCDCILTADSGIRDTYVLDPPAWSPGAPSTPMTVLRPEVPMLQSIIAWLETR